mgnify:FL=1
MNKTMLIVDDFYASPDEVRNFALTKNFVTAGNYPGYRTECEEDDRHTYLKTFLENLMGETINYWPKEHNTSYQVTTEKDTTWVHHDDTDWAGVLFLTPNPPIESGTAIYKHKQSGISWWDGIENSASDLNGLAGLDDLSNWEQQVFVGNVYNRLVLFRGNQYHRSLVPGFGNDKYTGRLFQVFFFNVEQ